MKSGMVTLFAVACVAALAVASTKTTALTEPRNPSFWMFLGAPLGDTNVKEILVEPDNDLIWYVTSGSNGVYISRDGGTSWEQRLAGNIGAIALDPDNPAVVYAGSGSDLYWSTNRGQSWTLKVPFPNPIPGTPADSSTFIDSVLVSAVDGTVFVGLSSMLHSARVYKTLAAGTWTVAYQSTSGYHIWDLAEDPGNGNLFFSTEDASHAVNPVVMRSTNRGQTWQEMVPLTGYLTDGHGLELAVHPATRKIFFLRENSYLFWSTDSGDSWPTATYVDFGSTLLLDRYCPNRVFGGEMVRGVKLGGVYVSDNGGQSFTFQGPAHNSISSLALDSTSSTLWAVAHGAGLWELDIDGLLSCSGVIPIFADGFESGGTSRWSSTSP